MADFDREIDKKVEGKFLIIDKKLKEAFIGVKKDIAEVKSSLKDNKDKIPEQKVDTKQIEDKIESLNEEIERLSALSVKSPKVDNEKLKLEKQILQLKIKEAREAQKNKSSGKISRLINRIGVWKEKHKLNKQYRKQLEQINQKHNQFEQELIEKTKQLDKLYSNSAKKAENKFEETTRRIEQEREIDKQLLTTQKEQIEREKSELTKEHSRNIYQIEKRFEKLIDNVESKRREDNQFLTNQLSGISQNLDYERKRTENSISELKTEINNLKSKKIRDEKRISELENEKNYLQDKLKEVKSVKGSSRSFKLPKISLPKFSLPKFNLPRLNVNSNDIKSGFWLAVPYIFLAILAIVALNQYFKWDVVSMNTTYWIVAGILFGGLTFWHNRDKIESYIKNDKINEESNEKRRADEFEYRFPRISKIWGLRNVAKWLYANGLYAWILIGIMVILFFIYVYNVSTIKFLDTDETRLFYDGKLILDGKTPFKDFDARSPFIIYFLAGFINLFGNSLDNLYYLSAGINLLTVLLLFIFTSRIFDKKVSLLTSVIFGISPIMINLLHIKTQTFSLPLIIISFIFYDNYLKDKSYLNLLSSVIFILLAIFSRESSIVFLLAFFVLIFIRNNNKQEIKKQIVILFVLIVSVTLIFLILNRLFFTYQDNSFTSGLLNASYGIDNNSKDRFSLVTTYFSESYLILFAISFLSLIAPLYFYHKNNKKISYNVLFPFFMFGALTLLYLYEAFRHGFWPQYLMEFSPFYSMAVALGIVIIIKNYKKYSKFLIIFVIFFLVILSNLAAYQHIQEYMGIYEKQGSEEVAKYISNNSHVEDIIFGGNPIYSFLSERDQFMDLSHNYYGDSAVEEVSKNLILTPPRYIIGDSYIDKYYLSNKDFKKIIENNYTKIKTFNYESYDKRWSADIYRLKLIKTNSSLQ